MKLIDVEALPDPETDPVAAAEIYLALAPVRSWQATASKKLKALVIKSGAIETMEGTLDEVFAAYEYPVQIADEIGFGVNQYMFTLPMKTDHTAIKELLLEGFPQDANDLHKTWSVTTVVDKERCKVWATDPDMKDTPEAQAIKRLRTATTKLGLR